MLNRLFPSFLLLSSRRVNYSKYSCNHCNIIVVYSHNGSLFNITRTNLFHFYYFYTSFLYCFFVIIILTKYHGFINLSFVRLLFEKYHNDKWISLPTVHFHVISTTTPFMSPFGWLVIDICCPVFVPNGSVYIQQ